MSKFENIDQLTFELDKKGYKSVGLKDALNEFFDKYVKVNDLNKAKIYPTWTWFSWDYKCGRRPAKIQLAAKKDLVEGGKEKISYLIREKDDFIKVKNRHGVEIDFAEAAIEMDSIISEQLAFQLAPCTEQEFFTAYENEHHKVFGEDWYYSRILRVYRP